jgi:hypothetical protein
MQDKILASTLTNIAGEAGKQALGNTGAAEVMSKLATEASNLVRGIPVVGAPLATLVKIVKPFMPLIAGTAAGAAGTAIGGPAAGAAASAVATTGAKILQEMIKTGDKNTKQQGPDAKSIVEVARDSAIGKVDSSKLNAVFNPFINAIKDIKIENESLNQLTKLVSPLLKEVEPITLLRDTQKAPKKLISESEKKQESPAQKKPKL